MPQPEAPAARSGAIQGAAYSESAFNGASMPTPARSLFPKLAFFISLLEQRAAPQRPLLPRHARVDAAPCPPIMRHDARLERRAYKR